LAYDVLGMFTPLIAQWLGALGSRRYGSDAHSSSSGLGRRL